MSPTHVLIISPNALFREGLKRILGKDNALILIGEACSLDEVDEQIRYRADVVVVEQQGDPAAHSEMLSQLLTTPAEQVRIVSLNLDEEGMQIYRREHVDEPSVERLISVLKIGDSIP